MMKLFAFLAICLGAAHAQPEAKVVEVEYNDTYDSNFPLRGFVSIPEQTPAPAVVIIVSFQREPSSVGCRR